VSGELTKPPGDPAALLAAVGAIGQAIIEGQDQLGVLMQASTPDLTQMQGKFAAAVTTQGQTQITALRAALDACAGATDALREYAYVLEAAQSAYARAVAQIAAGTQNLTTLQSQSTAESGGQTDGGLTVIDVIAQGEARQQISGGTQAAIAAYQDAADQALLAQQSIAAMEGIFGESGAALTASENAINRSVAVADGPMGAAESAALLEQAGQMKSLQSRLDAVMSMPSGTDRTAAMQALFASLSTSEALALAASDPRVGTTPGVPQWATIASNGAYLAAARSNAAAELASLPPNDPGRKALEAQLGWLDGAGRLPWLSQPPLTQPTSSGGHSHWGLILGITGAVALTAVNAAQFGLDPATDAAEGAEITATVADGTADAAVTADETVDAATESAGLTSAEGGTAAETTAETTAEQVDQTLSQTLANKAGKYGARYAANFAANLGTHAAVNVADGERWNSDLTVANVVGAPAVAALFPEGDGLVSRTVSGAANGASASLFEQESASIASGHGVVIPKLLPTVEEAGAGAVIGVGSHAATHIGDHPTEPEPDYVPKHAAPETVAQKAADSYLKGLREQSSEFANPRGASDYALEHALDTDYKAFVKPHLPGQPTDGGDGGG
jgi:hypothetical protein